MEAVMESARNCTVLLRRQEPGVTNGIAHNPRLLPAQEHAISTMTELWS
jgi:hypothetical protein